MNSLPEGIEITRFDPGQVDDTGMYRTAAAIQGILHEVSVDHYQGDLGLPIDTELVNPRILTNVLGQKRRLIESGSIEPEDGYVYWLARDYCDSGRIIGLCKVGRVDECTVEVEEIDVRDSSADGSRRRYRSKGIGRAMLAAALADPDIRDDETVTLEFAQGNRARELYERLGFEATGETRSYTFLYNQPPGEPPILHHVMAAPVSTVRGNLQPWQGSTVVCSLEKERTERRCLDTNSIGYVIGILDEIANGHLPQAAGNLIDKASALQARVIRFQATATDSSLEESRHRVDMLNQAINNLLQAASVLCEDNRSVLVSTEGYIKDLGGS